MGIDTGFTVQAVHFPGRGSDYFGACDVCGRHMAEAAVFEVFKLYKHEDGFLYLAAPTPGVYAHMDCRLHEGLRIVDKKTLPTRGRLIEYPREALKRDLLSAGFSDSSADEAMP